MTTEGSENYEKSEDFSYLYSWRNIMQRLKDLPFDETNCRQVHSEITEWYHRVMEIQELPASPSDVIDSNPTISAETDASLTENELDNETPSPFKGSHPTEDAGASNIVPYCRDFWGRFRVFVFKQSNDNLKDTCGRNLYIVAHRETVFLESFFLIHEISKHRYGHILLRSTLRIKLDGVEYERCHDGEDEQNLEYFSLMSKHMFDPQNGLFKYAPNSKTLEINPDFELPHRKHLEYYKFVGLMVGIAVFNCRNQLPEAYFIRPFYKMMLEKPITLSDIEAVDPKLFRSLSWIKENNPSGTGLTFTIDEKSNGNIVETDLFPHGNHILLTEENKGEYIEQMLGWRFVYRVKEQMSCFLDGFRQVIPAKEISGFDEGELEFMLSGVAWRYMFWENCNYKYIDVKAWRTNTSYIGYDKDDQVIEWFWTAVENHFVNETRARLLQFVTGTACVPRNGVPTVPTVEEHYFSNGPEHFTIKKWGTPGNVPTANTSLNRLNLPPFESFSDLKEKLITAVERSAGFEGQDYGCSTIL